MTDRHYSKGMTLVGILISLTIGLVVIAAAFRVFMANQKAYTNMQSLTYVLQDIRMVSDQMMRELRMTGFGVDEGESIVEAKAGKLVFRGDVDGDFFTSLAVNASKGDTQIQVDLNDLEPGIENDDLIFFDGGKRESVSVRSTGTWYDTTPEPDIIFLDQPLAYEHEAASTTVQTVETVTYQYMPDFRLLVRNNEIVSEEVESLVFHYFKTDGSELVPGEDGLNSHQLNSVQTFTAELLLLDEATKQQREVRRELSANVDLRNQGFLHFRNDHCPPKAPTQISLKDNGTCHHFEIQWSPPTQNSCDDSTLDDLSGYRIYFGSSPGDYYAPAATIYDPDADRAWVRDLRLENGQTYYTSVAALDSSFNESTLSQEKSFTINDTDGPDPPTTIEAVAGVESVTLSWQKSVSKDALGYRIYRGEEEDFTPSAGNLVTNEDTLGAGDTQYTDSGLTPCVTYYYILTAVDCVQEGDYSSAVYGDGNGAEQDSPTGGTTNTTPLEETPAPPGKVDPLSASSETEKITINWVMPIDNDLEKLIVRYSTSGYPSSESSGTGLIDQDAIKGSAGSYEHTDLINGITYYYSAFAVDLCGNVSEAAQVSASPRSGGPKVRLIAPFPGQTLYGSDGIRVEAQAYDTGAANLSDPPNFTNDNSKGISKVSFSSVPSLVSISEYCPAYCGFGGDSSPCEKEDISNVCPGDYYVYATATNNDQESTTTPFVHVHLATCGLELDPDYVPATSGSYNQDVQYRTKNNCDGWEVTTQYKTIKLTWDNPNARLIGYGIGGSSWEKDYRWNKYVALESGIQISLSGWVKLWPGDSFVEELHFSYWHTKLSSNRSKGYTTFNVYSADGFQVGDTIYFDNRSSQPRTITAISGNTITINSALPWYANKNWTVCVRSNIYDINMTSANITAEYEYKKKGNSTYCPLVLEIPVSSQPFGGKVYQDRPQADTVAMTVVDQITVQNAMTVPVHVNVSDWSGSGIDSVKLFYDVDGDFLSEAPGAGYSTLNMGYDYTDARYEVTIPAASTKRVWYYIEVEDYDGGTVRLPIDGAYTFDFEAIELPECPSGLTATKKSNNKVNLSWDFDDEEKVVGYNIYRRKNCEAFELKYEGVTDTDANTNGVQYRDQNSGIALNSYCYTYYVTSVDIYGNESSGCEENTAYIGKNCPSDCSSGDDDDDDDDDDDVATFFVPDYPDMKTYKYSDTGNYIGSFALSSANNYAKGSAVKGSYVYILDKTDRRVYRYTQDGGTPDVSGQLRSSSNQSLSEPKGLAIIDDEMWISDDSTKQVHRYSLSWAFHSNGNKKAEATFSMSGSNDATQGLAVDDTYFYVLDDEDDKVYRYLKSNGSRSNSKTMKRMTGGSFSKLSGAAMHGSYLWVVEDGSDQVICKFGASDLFSSGGSSRNASYEFELNSANTSPEGL